MKQAALIARHEFLETVRRPAFYLSILFIILSGAVSGLIPLLIEKTLLKPVEITIADQSGGLADALTTTLNQEDFIDDIARINAVIRNNLRPDFQEGATPGPQGVPIPYLKFRKNITSSDIADFLGRDGPGNYELDTYIAGARAYTRDNTFIPVPKRAPRIILNESEKFNQLTGTTRERVSRLLSTHQQGVKADRHLLLLIPEGFNLENPNEKPISLWTQKSISPELARDIQGSIERFAAELNARSRDEWPAIERYTAQTADLRYHSLDKIDNDQGSAKVDLVSWLVKRLPIGLLFIVIIIVFMQSYVLLSNTMEEKSNKIVEVMLSSVSPDEFMLGKMLGPLYVLGFFVVLVFLLGLAFTNGLSFFIETPQTGPIPPEAQQALNASGASALKTVVQPLIDGLLPKIPGALLYSTLAYFTYAGLFLTTGAYCTDMRQVQSLSMPLNLLLLGVQALALVAAFDPDGSLAQILTWIPLTSPFVMVGRLGAEVAWWEYLGTIVIQIAVIYLTLRLAGRLFRHAALKGEGLPTLKQLGQVIMGRAG